MVVARRRSGLGVDMCLPKKGGGYCVKPFTTLTQASADLLCLLAWDEPVLTWSEICKAINFDPEAVAVAARFVEEGYGDVLAREHLSRPRGV